MKKIISFFFVLLFSLVFNSGLCLSETISDDIQQEVSGEKEQMIPENNKKNKISNSSIEDIFGDEQTFPFVAGLGKNAAH